MAKKAKKKKKKKAAAKTTKPETPAPKVTPYPTPDKAEVQEFQGLIDQHLAGDTEPAKPKRGPGRPPKEKTPEPEEPELTIDIVAGVIKIPFQLWSISQSVKSLELTDEEAQRIAEPAKQLLEYYLPKIPVIAYAWVSVSVSTFWVMQTRLRTIQEIKKHRERLKKPKTTEPAQPGVKTEFPTELVIEKIEKV